jgi:flagellar assembly factor FliW
MIRLAKTRFGDIEVDDSRAVNFPRGLIGFPEARRFVLLEPRGRVQIAWLQSLDVPELAFPVVDGATLGNSYPQPPPQELARGAGLGATQLALLVIVASAGQHKNLVANLLAPLVVDLESRTGAQVVLDHRAFSASAPLGTSLPSAASQ